MATGEPGSDERDNAEQRVDRIIPWRNKDYRFWHHIPTAEPDRVAGLVEDQCGYGACLGMELGRRLMTSIYQRE